jgi:hypothetical protein
VKKSKKVDRSLASRNAASTYAGGIRTGNDARPLRGWGTPVKCDNFKRANINAWAPHPPVSTIVPRRTENPVFPKLKRGAKILRAVAVC